MIQFAAEDTRLVGSMSWWGASRCFVAGVEERKELGWHPGTVLHPIQLNYPYLATTIYPNVIIVRDLRDGREVTRYVGDEEYLLPTACWVSSRAERLVTIYGRKVQVVDTREEKVINEWKLTASVTPMLPLSYSKRLNSIAMGTFDGRIFLLRLLALSVLEKVVVR